MRLAFFIICMAAIGVAVVHIQTQENLLNNRMLTLRTHSNPETTRLSGEMQKDIAFLMSPPVVSNRAVAMNLPMVDKRDRNTGLARDTSEGSRSDSARRPRPPVPPNLDGRPRFHD